MRNVLAIRLVNLLAVVFSHPLVWKQKGYQMTVMN